MGCIWDSEASRFGQVSCRGNPIASWMVHFMEKSIKTDENWGGYPHDLGNSHVNIMGIIDKWSVFIGKSSPGD